MKIYQIQLKLQKSGNSPVEGKEVDIPFIYQGFLKFQWQFQVVGNGISDSINIMLSTTGWENPKAGCDLCKGICPQNGRNIQVKDQDIL